MYLFLLSFRVFSNLIHLHTQGLCNLLRWLLDRSNLIQIGRDGNERNVYNQILMIFPRLINTYSGKLCAWREAVKQRRSFSESVGFTNSNVENMENPYWGRIEKNVSKERSWTELPTIECNLWSYKKFESDERVESLLFVLLLSHQRWVRFHQWILTIMNDKKDDDQWW